MLISVLKLLTEAAMRWDVRRLGLVLIAFAVAGCQQRTSPPPVKSATPVVSDADGSSKSDESPDAVGDPAPPDAAPVAAVKKVLQDIEDGRLEALGEFLPDAYVRDLEALLRSAAKKTPDNVWLRLHSLIGKIAQLNEARPESFGENSAVNQQQLRALLDALAEKSAWDRDNWQKVELRTLLRTMAAKLDTARSAETPSKSKLLSQTNVRLKDMQQDRATLLLQSPLDQEPQSVEFVLVDGKWIPQPLAEAWADSVQSWITWLDSVSEETVAEASQRVGPALLQIDGTLDQMLKAEQREEVQLGWWQIQSLIVQARLALLEPGPPPRVELLLSQDVSDEQLTKLLEQLMAVADDPEAAEYVTFPSASGMVIQLSPVAGFDEFVKRLTFVTVQSEDAETRRVNVELPSGK